MFRFILHFKFAPGQTPPDTIPCEQLGALAKQGYLLCGERLLTQNWQ